MQAFTDFFKTLSRLFRMVDHGAKAGEKLVNQVAYNLDKSEQEAKFAAIAARRDAQKNAKITDAELKAFDESFWD